MILMFKFKFKSSMTEDVLYYFTLTGLRQTNLLVKRRPPGGKGLKTLPLPVSRLSTYISRGDTLGIKKEKPCLI